MGTLGIPWCAQRYRAVERTCASAPCTEPFVALHPKHVYCSPRCRARVAMRRYTARWGWRGKPVPA